MAIVKKQKETEMEKWTGPLFGLVLKVEDMPPPDKNNPGDPIYISGTVQSTIPGVANAGDKVFVNVDAGKNLESSRDNLNKGGDIDSIIIFDRCRLDKNEDGSQKLGENGEMQISSAYLRNVVIGTGFGKRDPKQIKHSKRMILGGVVDTPMVSFHYDGSMGGKEGYLSYPINAKYKDYNFNVGGDKKTVRITEDFVKNTLRSSYEEALGQGGVGQALRRVQVTMNVFETDKAIKVSDVSELQDSIATSLNSYANNGVALVRIVDAESGDMLVRKVFNKGYGDGRTDPKIVAETFIQNNSIDVSAASVVEVVPGVTIRYMGQSDQTLNGKFAKEYLDLPGKSGNNTVNDIAYLGLTKSGTDDQRFTSVAFSVEPSEKIPGYVVPITSPLVLLRDATFKSEHIQTANIALDISPEDLQVRVPKDVEEVSNKPATSAPKTLKF